VTTYPREFAFVEALPKTASGNVRDRRRPVLSLVASARHRFVISGQQQLCTCGG